MNTSTGKLRVQPPAKYHGLWPHEIEPGRSVPADWNKALTETWAERKARRAAERAISHESMKS